MGEKSISCMHGANDSFPSAWSTRVYLLYSIAGTRSNTLPVQGAMPYKLAYVKKLENALQSCPEGV